MNIDGNISPGEPNPTNNEQTPTILPYKADIDTSTEDGGNIWYRLSNDSTLLKRALNDSRKLNQSILFLDYALIATWDRVHAYNGEIDAVCVCIVKYS